jgi:hypothetical protein
VRTKFTVIARVLLGVFILLCQNRLIHAAPIWEIYNSRARWLEERPIPPEVANLASQSLPRPQIEEFDEVLNFLRQAPPQLNATKPLTSQIYAYNISLLVSFAKVNEAIQYAQQYWNSRQDGNSRVDNQILLKTLNQLAEYNTQFQANVFEAEKTWKQNDPKLAVQYVEEALEKGSPQLELTADMIYQTQLAPASRIYYNLAQRLRATQKIMKDYEQQYNRKVFQIQQQKRREEQRKRLANSKVPSVSINELVQAFMKNEEAAIRKYKGKKIRIDEKLSSSISETQNPFYKQSPAIFLDTPFLESLLYPVICNFDNAEQISSYAEFVYYFRNADKFGVVPAKTVTIEGTVLDQVLKVRNDDNSLEWSLIQLINCEIIAYD